MRERDSYLTKLQSGLITLTTFTTILNISDYFHIKRPEFLNKVYQQCAFVAAIHASSLTGDVTVVRCLEQMFEQHQQRREKSRSPRSSSQT